MMIIANSATPMAAPYPNLNWPNACSYWNRLSVWHCRSGPQVTPDVLETSSGSVNIWRPPIVEVMTVKMMTGRREGIVMCRNCFRPLAPSTAAAS